jgi:hypothetical protein
MRSGTALVLSLTITSFAADGFFVRALFVSFHNPKLICLDLPVLYNLVWVSL